MATTNSKDEKSSKVMDVSRPGRSAPSPSAKPIIVSNRPMLRQDPMMASPDGLDKPEPTEETMPVSRTAKTIPVGVAPGESSQSAPTTPAKPATEPTAATVPETPTAPPIPAPTASELAAKLESPAPSVAVATAPDGAKEAAVNTPEEKPAGPEPATETPQPETSESPAPAASAPPATDDDETDETSAGDQLAPNQALEEAKQKEEEAKAARLAEEEKIVASKQFYLPMHVNEERRGLDRTLLVLALVLIVSLVWADVVLDAGILHIGGVHALTHFFS